MNSLYNTIKFEDVYILNSLSILQWISFMQIQHKQTSAILGTRGPPFVAPQIWRINWRAETLAAIILAPCTACFRLLIFLINSFNNIQWITLFLNDNLWYTLTIIVFIHHILQSKQLYKCSCLTFFHAHTLNKLAHRRSTCCYMNLAPKPAWYYLHD